MKILKKAFLYFVGAVSVAYDEAHKVYVEQSKKVRTNGAFSRIKIR